MKASDYLAEQRDASLYLLKTTTCAVNRQSIKFCARLCDELNGIINVDAVLNEAQAEFVGMTVGNVGYKFLPGHDVKYKETPITCPFLLMQLATYINSCK